MKFNYNLPVNLLFGRGRVQELGVETCKYGKKALIVTGQNSTKKTGLLDKSIKLLNEAGVEVVVFDKVKQNPLTTTVTEGVELVHETKCDVIVGLGGGSIMDAAKGIAFMSLNEGDISDYIYAKKQSDKKTQENVKEEVSGAGASQRIRNKADLQSPAGNVEIINESYIVRKGDTLSQIVWRQYHSFKYIKKVMKVNNIKNSDEIYEGDCIMLPDFTNK